MRTIYIAYKMVLFMGILMIVSIIGNLIHKIQYFNMTESSGLNL